MSSIDVLVPEWNAPRNVRSLLTLRYQGGAIEDTGRVREALSLPGEPAWLEQVHGIEVADLDRPWKDRPRADASITRTTQRVCVARTADCMPVLFADRAGHSVGAAHAGWRGMAAGVLEATVTAMGVKPQQLCAWLGPAIGPRHFEVGDEVRAAFLGHSAQAQIAFERNGRGRWQCDLYTLARQRLAAMGLADISGGGWCTYADPERFYSFRREGRTGRMAALIWLTGCAP
jgi:YfiH family protein